MSNEQFDKPNAFHVGSMKFEAGQVYVDDAGNKYVVSSAVSSIATCPCGDILAIQEKKCDRADCPVVAKSPSARLSPSLVEQILGIVNYEGWQGEIFRQLQAELRPAHDDISSADR